MSEQNALNTTLRHVRSAVAACAAAGDFAGGEQKQWADELASCLARAEELLEALLEAGGE